MTQNAKDNPWWRGGVIYQIYPRSYFDSNGDGSGDLKGIVAKLDYVKSLGVDAVWISPFLASPMKDFGYDVSNYRDINPLFGTLDDFNELRDAMHTRGIRLLMDLILNHTSDQHPWFLESRQNRENSKADWYVWADPKADGGPPNNWLSVFGGPAWTYDTRRGQYYLHQFLKEQPDLNVRNPDVQQELLDTLKWWLDRGVDGFRLDVLNHCIQDEELRDNPPNPNIDRARAGKDRNNHPYYWQSHVYDRSRPENLFFVERIRTLLDSYSDRMAIAEIYDDNPVETSALYTQGDKRMHTAYNFAMMLDGANNPQTMRQIISTYMVWSDSWPAWAFSNHDLKRVATRWAPDGRLAPRELITMTFALQFTLRGTICLYQGEELGLPEADVPFERLQDPYGIFLWPEDKGRDGCRTPMPWTSHAAHAGFSTAHDSWLPVPAEHQLLAVDAQEADSSAPLHAARRLIALRKTEEALRAGNMVFVDNLPDTVLGYWREDILCLFNMSADTAVCTVPADLHALDLQDINGTYNASAVSLPAWGFWLGRRA